MITRMSANPDAVYRLHISFHFSFDFFPGDIILSVGKDGGTSELVPRFCDDAGQQIPLTKQEVKKFYSLYKKLDFYNPKPYSKSGLVCFDGWELNYTICDGTATKSVTYQCPDRTDKVWALVEYTMEILKKHLSPEDFEQGRETLLKYSG